MPSMRPNAPRQHACRVLRPSDLLTTEERNEIPVRSCVSACPLRFGCAQLSQTDPVFLSRLVDAMYPPQILLASSGARHTLLALAGAPEGCSRQNHRAIEHAFEPFLDTWIVQGRSDGDRNRPNLAVGSFDALLELHPLHWRLRGRQG